jgi:hypothetical protein
MDENRGIFVRVRQSTLNKLDQIAKRSHRQRSGVITALIEGAVLTEEGGISFQPMCAPASTKSHEPLEKEPFRG